MARRDFSPQEIHELRRLAGQWGKVGECNARVKGKQKFWNRPQGAEAILQVRAALLSEDGRLERYFAERPGSPHRRRAG